MWAQSLPLEAVSADEEDALKLLELTICCECNYPRLLPPSSAHTQPRCWSTHNLHTAQVHTHNLHTAQVHTTQFAQWTSAHTQFAHCTPHKCTLHNSHTALHNLHTEQVHTHNLHTTQVHTTQFAQCTLNKCTRTICTHSPDAGLHTICRRNSNELQWNSMTKNFVESCSD